jgi:Zn-dependent peptidase ImmA (M78 family)
MQRLEQINAETLGERLRIARENAKLTQEEAAAAIDVARTTLVAMEQGQRRVRMGELQKLAHAYHTSVNALLRQESVHVDLAPRFRKMFDAKDTATAKAAELLANLAKAEVELENLLGIKRARNYPPERPLLPGDVKAQAEQDAAELRNRLGLGIRPVPDIMTLLELEMGVRVYVRRLDSKISGLFVYDDALGPCILLNASHPRERRVQSASHETGHLVSSREAPEVLYRGGTHNTREERYADVFARAFLTPARGVMQKFQEVTAGSDRLTRRHVIILAHFFGVSREAMVRRLEELHLAKDGTWDWFESNGNITDEQARQVLGELTVPDADKADADNPTTLRLGLLAAEAYRKELLSEGQLARLLCLNRVELREILDREQSEGIEVDGTVPNVVD